MTSNIESCTKPAVGQCSNDWASAQKLVCPSEPDEVLPNVATSVGLYWRDIPLYRQLLLGAFFIAAFLVLDGSSNASRAWEGAPPLYLPVGLGLALLLCGGMRCVPVLFVASVVAAILNYHRPIFSWCGVPGSIAIYLGYVACAAILRGRWRLDLKLATLADVGRYILACFGGTVVSAFIGMLTLLGDGKIAPSDILNTTAEWWVSDTLAIITFTPFLLLFVAPFVVRWLRSGIVDALHSSWRVNFSVVEILELTAQSGLVLFAIWLVFGYTPAIPYQPLYLLFISVIWVAVRRGLPGAILTTFAISFGMTLAAWITQAERGSLPRLQLAMLALGLTGLCLGAVVSERKKIDRAIRESEKRYRLLFERNLAGVFRTTLTGRILECNPAAAHLFGFDSPPELLATPTPGGGFAQHDNRNTYQFPHALPDLEVKSIRTSNRLRKNSDS